MSNIYKGDEFIYAVTIEDEDGDTMARAFNQTGGSTNISADSIEINTKDRSGSDYGNTSQEISLEGLVTEGDPFVDYVKKAIRAKKFVKIHEVNTRKKTSESGLYMISSFDRSFSNGDHATYSLSGTLNGDITEEELMEIPEGDQEGVATP